MQAPRTLDADEPFADLDADLSHTYILLLACNLTQALAPPFAQLLTDLDGLWATETKLERDVDAQEAAILFADDDLNVLLDETKKEVLAFVGGNYGADLYKQLFGDLSPSELRRFLLSEQLQAMRLWPAALAATSSATLKDLGVRITTAVAHADKVLDAQTTATAARDAFVAGPRTAFVAAANAARGAVFGKLLELAKDPANAPLPADFVDRFFVRDTSGRAPRLEELNKSIDRLTARLGKVTAQRDDLKAKQAKALLTKQQADLAAKQAKLAGAQDESKQLAAEVAALQAEIAKEQGK